MADPAFGTSIDPWALGVEMIELVEKDPLMVDGG